MPAARDPATVTVPVPAGRVVTDPAQLRWGVVATIRAPLRQIARFAAYHLDLGAAEIHVYLDQPDPETAAFFDPHPAVTVTQCDATYWSNVRKKRPETHQLRQAINATRCYRKSQLNWLAHIDVDEFLISKQPIADLLAAVPPEAAFARLRPAELLAQPDPWEGPAHFKLTRRETGHTKAVLARIYPEFGVYVPDGFFSYTGGKNIARTGLAGVRLGIHALMKNSARVDNGHALSAAHVGHAHAPSFEEFEHRLNFRLEKGSYRKKNSEGMALRDVLDVVMDVDGRAGLRRLFDEMCLARPELLTALAAHDMLLTAALDLDRKTAHWFGALPDAGQGTHG